MTNLARFAHSVAAAAIIAGCSGLQSLIGTQTNNAGSGMLPGTSGQNLIYASGAVDGGSINGQVYIYTMDGTQITAVCCFYKPAGLCSDKAGNVFLVAATGASLKSSRIYKFRHGSSKIVETLDDPGYGQGCAVDPRTGNLAVANVTDASNYQNYGDVAIYAHAKGNPTLYQSSQFSSFWFCGYDNAKNLYVSASPVNGEPDVADLLRLGPGSASFDTINLSVQLKTEPRYFEPSVQWDGKYITVTSARPASGGMIRPDVPQAEVAVYRLKVVQLYGMVMGKTTLESGYLKQHIFAQSWIQGNVILGHYVAHYEYLGLWQYPQGGVPEQSIRMPAWAEGITVSVAPS